MQQTSSIHETSISIEKGVGNLFSEYQQNTYRRTDRMFAILMAIQWVAGIAAAIWISPLTWIGVKTSVHPHVWASVFLGSLISFLPIILALTRPGEVSTRYAIAVGQMLMGALLIHLTGGRIETHFHIFGSLAFLAFYRDWRVLVPATLVVILDHILRGIFFPESIFGVLVSDHWRWLEHAGWIIFIDIFLVILCLRSTKELRDVAEKTAVLEVAERKRALRLGAERYQDLFENANDLIITYDPNGTITSLNKAAKKITGYTSLEAIKMNIRQLIAPENQESAAQAVMPDAAASGPDFYELMLVTKDGRRILLEASTRLTSENGVPVGVQSIARDITRRKQAEARLRTSQMRLAEAQGIARVGSFEIDLVTGRVEWSAELWHIFGLEPREAGLSFEEYIQKVHPDDFDEVKSLITRSYSENEFYPFECRIIRPDGVVRFIKINGNFHFSEEGRPLKVIGIQQDITEQHEMEAELRRMRDVALESARLKSEFLANMSHEIRTPMNGVIGMTGLLMDTPLSEDQYDFAETIRSSGDALLTIINDILDFSKIESGKLQFETLDFDLDNVVEDTVELLAEKAREKRIEFASLIYSDVTTKLCGDPGRLRQVLTNLIGNAIKFTETGEVIIRTAKETETETDFMVRFSISDTGIGISESARRNLFQAFIQADGSTTRKYGGTGLGLAISKQLVELMGGEIGVESTPGKGSTFWFTAKFEKQMTPTIATIEPDRTNLRNLRTLIVDDNAANRKILSHQLASWGMLYEEADSGRRALEMLRRAALSGTPFELAVLDLMMPEMDGFELARAIKTDPELQSIQLVLLTSYGNRGDGQTAKEANIDAYLTKPVRQSLLFECLVRVVSQKSLPQLNAANAAKSKEILNIHNLTAMAAPVSGKLILLAEDNVINQKVAIRQLQKLGYRADSVANGLEALEALNKIPYDLILMDCQMPEMDGFAATAEIRRRELGTSRHIPIVAMTANALEGDKLKCLEAGMDDYLSKPVKTDMLSQIVERWILAPENTKGFPTGTEREVVNRSVLNSFKEFQSPDEPDIVTEMIDLFIENTDVRMQALKKAVSDGNTTVIKIEAHSIKGGAGNIGARKMSAIGREIEQNLADKPKVEILYAQLEQEFMLVKAVLNSMRAAGDHDLPKISRDAV